MPVREYYKNELVNYDWDSADALAGGGGAVVGGASGNQINGPLTIGGLGSLGTALGLGLSTLRTRKLSFYKDEVRLTPRDSKGVSKSFPTKPYHGAIIEYINDFSNIGRNSYGSYLQLGIGNTYRLYMRPSGVNLTKRETPKPSQEWLIPPNHGTIEIVPNLVHKVRCEILPIKGRQVLLKLYVDGELVGKARDKTTDLEGEEVVIGLHNPPSPNAVMVVKNTRLWEP